jgi:hypothetical protein
MPNPGLARADAEAVVRAVEDALRKGYRPPGRTGRGPGALAVTAEALGMPRNSVDTRLRAAWQSHGLQPDWSLYSPQAVRADIPDRPQAVEPPPRAEIPPPPFDLLAALRKRSMSLEDIAEAARISKGQALDKLDALRAAHVNLYEIDGKWSVEKTQPLRESGAPPRFEMVSDAEGFHRFGFVTDNHICSKYARLDVLNDLYDRFARRGITRVYNAGNWIDGEARFNRHDLLVHGMDAQLRELALRYPQRPGIETYAVSGDDHEGWYAHREMIDIGRLAERVMREHGRNDWHFMAHMEADVRLVHAGTGQSSAMRVVHPGGGSAYAISYSAQKTIESYDGGDKPAAVLFGHWHKQHIFNYRNVWAIQAGTTEDQTPFMRKLKLEAHVGGMIVTFEQDGPSGALISCNDIYRYFNREFYTSGPRYSTSGPVTHPARSLGGV